MVGKFYVFSAAYERGWWWLVVIGVVATAVSIYYYLAVVRSMYMRAELGALGFVAQADRPPRDPALDVGVGAALAVTVGSFFFVCRSIDLAGSGGALPF